MRFLLLNQTFHPDLMATGQYLAQLAAALVERGHSVTVVTSRRAYDKPETRFPARERWRGVEIRRVWSTGCGKRAKWRRAADFGSFIASCSLRLLLLPKHDVVVALTSPPLISVIGAGLACLRGSRFCYWIMDFNPDEAIAAGWLQRGSWAARMLDAMSRFSLRRASRIVALDRFMRDRVVAKNIAADRVAILPPWSLDDAVRFDPAGRERFRRAHGLSDRFVIMYSGNHSPCHPLDTLMNAALRLRQEPVFLFCFVGGGSEFARVSQFARENKLTNVLCLPYQPLDQLSASLSAADLHTVVMGDAFVGLVHPCKVYNILAVGAPTLYIGPCPSHVTEIFQHADETPPCFHASHGDVDTAVRHIRESTALNRQPPRPQRDFSKGTILPRLMAVLEGGETLADSPHRS